MTYLEEHLSVTLPLPPIARLTAEEFWEYHENCQKAREVFLNTLAVYAVHSYLQKLGISTSLKASDSWNPSTQRSMNVADLWVANMGKLECRPVWPEVQVCPIPIEVRENRIGYVVVQISESLRAATILGFSQTALTGNLRINELESLEYLIEILTPVHLSQWLQNVFDTCWQTVEALLQPESNELAFCCRSPRELRTHELRSNTVSGVKRAKLIELGEKSASQQVVLVVALTPVAEEELNVWVEVYPTGNQTYLPCNLDLMLLDENGKVVMKNKNTAETTKNIQLKLSGERGEHFSVKVALGEMSTTEAFLI